MNIKNKYGRRNLLSFLLILLLVSCRNVSTKSEEQRPNFVIFLTDQWRSEAFGHRGNPDVLTPNLDKLANEGVLFINAVSALPACTPARASMLTGQRPLSHGVFMNDVPLDTSAVSLAKVMAENNYQTAYIGKWHLDGQYRSRFIPKGRRQGFEYWNASECTHDYNHSYYYGNTPDTLLWEGYDAIAQTNDACDYLTGQANDKSPFLLFLSYGPPHAPYQTAPEEYRKLYSPESISLRPNVPEEFREKTKKDLAGYYAHCTALDAMMGKLRETLKTSGLNKNTIIVFLSDHGDMLGSHGGFKKQQPYAESYGIPMIFYVPDELGGAHSVKKAMMNVEDLMPTLLGFASFEIPETVEGINYSNYILGQGENPGDSITLITCVQPFGQWNRNLGGQEYRGLVSENYTYVRDLNGPWLFFDNRKDPLQMNNLVDNGNYTAIVKGYDKLLMKKLEENDDEFLPGMEYLKKYNYPELDERETVPYYK